MMEGLDTLIAVLIFIFGCIIGSFLNVVILRLNSGKGIGGRSLCFACGKQLMWYELFPVLSFFSLGGRCKGCRTPISWLYPLVELGTGAVFSLLYTYIAPTNFAWWVYLALHLIAAALLMVIFVYDIRHKIIPDKISFSLMAVAFATLFIGGRTLVHLPALWDFLGGIIFFAVFGGLWLVSKGRWIGFGDAKLVLSLGWLSGFVQGLSGIVVAFWVGAILSVLILVLQGKGRTMKGVEVPFAPYLIIGCYIAWLCHLDLLFLHEFWS